MGAARPALSPGDSVTHFGPGQQGLGCVLAAAMAGAAPIIVAGLEADAQRLAVARELGATHVIYSERGAAGRAGEKHPRRRDGRRCRRVTGSVAAQQATGIWSGAAARWCCGRVLNDVVEFEMDKVASRGISMIGVRGHESDDTPGAR